MSARSLLLVLDFKPMEVLDLSMAVADPSSLVHHYECDWWLGTVAPGEESVLGPITVEKCLRQHRKIRQHTPSIITYEKPSYTWGQGAFSTAAGGEKCNNCRLMHGIVTAACDELRELRQMVDAFNTHFGVEQELVNRCAGGAYSLFTLAELKETNAGGVLMDAVTGQHVELPSAPPEFVPGHIRLPKKGPAVVQKVRQAAGDDLS
jgi:hypothetical protein